MSKLWGCVCNCGGKGTGLKTFCCNHSCLSWSRECSSAVLAVSYTEKGGCEKARILKSSLGFFSNSYRLLSTVLLSGNSVTIGKILEGTSKPVPQINSALNVSSYFRFYSTLALEMSFGIYFFFNFLHLVEIFVWKKDFCNTGFI